jgi:hypothetical protein
MDSRLRVGLGVTLVAMSFAILGACSGGSSSNPAASGDAGNDVTGSEDAPGDAADAKVDGPADAGIDAPPPPSGTLLALDPGPILLGMTSDGFAVYYANDNTLYAVDASGRDSGAPISIAQSQPTGGDYFDAVVVGPVVFFWPNLPTGQASPGSLFVWSHATGVHPIPGVTVGGFAAASGDGSKIVYGAMASGTATSGDITVAGTDGSNPTVLESQVPLDPQCVPQVSFVGASRADALVAYCAASDAGPKSATLDAFQGPSWTKTTLASGLKPSNPNLIAAPLGAAPLQGNVYVVDPSSSNILTTTTANEAVAITYPAGISSNLESAAAMPVCFAGSGGAVDAVYATLAGAVHASTFPAGTPSTLVSSGATYVYTDTSPDGKWGIYATTGTMTTDLTLFATSPPATTKKVVTTPDALLAGGGGASSIFTGDSSHFIWDDGLTQVVGGLGTWTTTHAYDLSTGTSATVADKVWIHDSVGSGTTVVYNDNTTLLSVAVGTGLVADIKVVDVAASPLAPRLVQADVDANFLVTPDQKTVVYAYTQGTDAGVNGVYAVPLP